MVIITRVNAQNPIHSTSQCYNAERKEWVQGWEHATKFASKELAAKYIDEHELVDVRIYDL